MLSSLSKVFQLNFVMSIVEDQLLELRFLKYACYSLQKTNLNQDLFNEENGYHIFFEFGPPCGYLK